MAQMDQATEEYLQVEQLMKERFKAHNTIAEACFLTCVKSFPARFSLQGPQLDEAENKCITNCFEKYMEHSKIVGRVMTQEMMRYHNAGM